MNQRWSRVSHYQAERKESHSEPVTPLGTGHPMMFKKLSGCIGSPRPRAHHDPPLVSDRTRAEACYSRPALCCRAILTPSIVSECFPWLSAISVGLPLKPLHYGLCSHCHICCVGFCIHPSSSPPVHHPLMFDFPANISCLVLNTWEQSQRPSSDPAGQNNSLL